MIANVTNNRTGFLSILVVVVALAGPAVAEVSIEMDRDRVFCTPAGVSGTVRVVSFPIAQNVVLTSSHPSIAQPIPPMMVIPALVDSMGCGLVVPAPVAEPTEVTITAVNQTAGGMDQATVMILPNRARFYVDAAAPGSDDGSSWGNAFNDLQDALSIADECSDIVNEIWVAAGTYRRSVRPDSFRLRNGLALYGGFLGSAPGGGETSLDQRDWVANETILSGDIGAVGDDTDNTYHVVISSGTSATAVLDGFTITGGYADSYSEPKCYGGGMYNTADGSPTVRHCTFSFNYARYEGGGMHSYGTPTLIDCRFIENSSDGVGGGMHSVGHATLVDCVFTDNAASSYGGGVRIPGGDAVLLGCTFNGNTANDGGGAYVSGSMSGTNPTLINCAFNGNWASTGGGVYADGQGVLTNCTFVDNVATVRGGGMHVSQGDHTLTNCTFGANTAANGEALSSNYADPVLTSCILWNSGDELENVSSTITITYSDVQGGWPGEGNIDSDPLFANPDDGDLSLTAGSPCIDAADSIPAASFDADGQGRAVDDPDTPNTGSGPADFVDMGAYEYRPVAAFADLDGDGDVDLEDAADFFLFFNGPR